MPSIAKSVATARGSGVPTTPKALEAAKLESVERNRSHQRQRDLCRRLANLANNNVALDLKSSAAGVWLFGPAAEDASTVAADLCVVALIAGWTPDQEPRQGRDWRVRPTAIRHQPLLRRHQFGDSRFEDLLIALVGLCNRLIVFIGREPSNCRFTVLELANQQDIAYGQSRTVK